MPRPRKCRKVNTTPEVTYFKPRGVPLRELAEVYLPLDGFEAIRLADHQGLSHEDAARHMQISRQTFGRILAAARQTIAKALVQGLALRIHGGEYQLSKNAGTGPDQCFVEVDASPNTRETKETDMKTIAITSEGPTLDDAVDPRFGRAAGFILVNPDSMTFEYIDNGNSQARAQGAGIQAAETVAQSGASGVLTGYVGPKAFQALAAAGIKVAQDLDEMTVREAIERFKTGDIVWAELEDAKGFGK